MRNKGLIVVSNRLPFYRKVDQWGNSTWKKAAGGLITALEPIVQEMNGIWIGWDGQPKKIDGHQELELMQAKDLFPESKKNYRVGCIPISESEIEEYYDRFSNSTLWALFHYFFEKCKIDYSAWRTYNDINQRFAVYIDQIASDNDIVWIQDYHLFLTPLFLRQLRPNLQIHFFLHIPFPHIDIFSILPWQSLILESLLCCNTIGFHHRQYLKNFKGAIEGLKGDAHCYVNPISIDFEHINQLSKDPAVIKRREEIRKATNCPKIMIGVDRIDYSKGIKERLKAIELLIQEYPGLKGKFYYYQLVVPSREAVESYKRLKKEVDEIVGRINGEYSTELWSPIHYHYGTVPFKELVALYSASDIALVTPLRDGMNLVSKEYIAAHSDEDGILILSKFAGAYAELKDSLAINPYSIEEIKDAIYHAIHMPQRERMERMRMLRNSVRKHDINHWLEECLKHFKK